MSSHWPGWCQLQGRGAQGECSLEILDCRTWVFSLYLAPALATYCLFGCNWEWEKEPQYRQSLKQCWDLSVPPVTEF